MNFTIRIYNTSYSIIHYDFNHITIGGITIISKRTKFDPVCLHNGNQKKFGYSIGVKGKFNKVSGSNSSPTISWKGEYIDIEISNFPRFPILSQDKYVARNILQSKDFNGNTKQFDYNNGFDELEYDILNLTN